MLEILGKGLKVDGLVSAFSHGPPLGAMQVFERA